MREGRLSTQRLKEWAGQSEELARSRVKGGRQPSLEPMCGYTARVFVEIRNPLDMI